MVQSDLELAPASVAGSSRRRTGGCVGLGSQSFGPQAPGPHSWNVGEPQGSGHCRLPASQHRSGPGHGTSRRQTAGPPWRSGHRLPGRPPLPLPASASQGAPGSTPALWEAGREDGEGRGQPERAWGKASPCTPHHPAPKRPVNSLRLGSCHAMERLQWRWSGAPSQISAPLQKHHPPRHGAGFPTIRSVLCPSPFLILL